MEICLLFVLAGTSNVCSVIPDSIIVFNIYKASHYLCLSGPSCSKSRELYPSDKFLSSG